MTRSSRRPNVLFLLSDQHSPHFLECDGNAVVRTPTLNRLASEGALFSHAYCQNPLCVPSRASLMTGRYCRNIGIYDNQDVMQANGMTLPRLLASAGYRTCLIGKSHFNGEQYHGYQQRPYGDLYGQAHQPDPRRLPAGGDSGLMGWPVTAGPSGIPLAMTQTEIVVAESAKWLQTHASLHSDQPFCLSVHFDKPHFPVNPPQRFFAHYDGAVDLPTTPNDVLARHVPFVRTAAQRFSGEGGYDPDSAAARRLLAAYYGCVEWVDDAVGRVLEVLDYLCLAGDTIVIYASDHGEMAGEHGTWQKTVFYDAAARVPLLMRWPGHISPEQRMDEVVGLIDILPTLSDLAGIELPDQIDGVSLAPLLCGERSIDRDGVFCESVVLKSPEDAGCMLRTGDWKFNCYLDGATELYHLASDPNEWSNLADDPAHADRVREFQQRVVSFWEPSRQVERYTQTPRMRREKHFYPYSNQFVLGDGQVADARP